MKKMKMIFTAIAIFAVVGGALAFKSYAKPNLVICGTDHFCDLPTTPYSSVINGTPVQNPPALFLIQDEGQRCPSGVCPHPYTGEVYINA